MKHQEPGRLTIAHFLLNQRRSETMSGSFLKAEAFFECGGCGKHFKTEITDGAFELSFFPTAQDFFLDTLLWGMPDSTSFQHGHILCATCTGIVDAEVKPPEADRNATEAEVLRGLKKCR